MIAKLRPASAIFLVVPFNSVHASGVSYDSAGFSFVFNGVATLALIISGLMAILGYRLLAKSANNGQPANGQLTIKIGSTKIDLRNAAAGVLFAGFGTIGMVVALLQLNK